MTQILSIVDVMKATEGFIRPMREGEEVLQCGLVIGVGIKERKGDELQVHALVLRTSGLRQTPYLVQIWIDMSKEYGARVIADESRECECPAGMSEKCKHIVAVMLHLARSLDTDLDDLSCTDVEQQWGAIKKSTLGDYEAKRLTDFCHAHSQKEVYATKMPEVTPAMEKKWSDRLVVCAPLSEFSIFFSGLRSGLGSSEIEEETACTVADQCEIARRLLTFRSWKALGLLKQWTTNKVLSLSPELREFYESKIVVSLQECVALGTCCQGTAEWKAARKKIMTSSKARAQYTYYVNRSADWEKRYQEVYHSTFRGNAFTQDGLDCEALARAEYEVKYQCSVFESGIIVRPELPWLGASVDGTVISEHGNVLKNIEIKTFKEGQRLSAKEMLEFGAINSLDKNGDLKQNHAHYTQVQLGLFCTGLEECDYVIYSQLGNPVYLLELFVM
ncbi:Serrate RNA effector molecule-like protein [Frankliniella fusca]|uniref:Serrate RNA effector molecule-like protein n=1 Tax=Frankliniella fusca TaxID=407009 RepID=A0AAE1GXU2_9NEOP|nr:Serrate RNA effector molecule-like protein [Frankliniella fusca]